MLCLRLPHKQHIRESYNSSSKLAAKARGIKSVVKDAAKVVLLTLSYKQKPATLILTAFHLKQCKYFAFLRSFRITC